MLVNGLVVGTLYGVVAMSFVLIYKATQVVNFAQGELLLVGAWVCWALLTKYQVPFWVGMPLTLVFMFAFGIAIQVVILRPMIGEPIISVIMVTIGLSTVFQASLKWIFGVNPQPFPQVFTSQSVNLLGLQIQTVYVMSLVVSVAMMVGMAWFFRASKYGLAMRATAFNQQVAQSLGISVKSVFAMAWAISATVSAVAGVVVAVVNGVSSGLSVYGIKVFPAAILGGLDSIGGAVLGGIIIGLLENIAQYIDSEYLHWGNLYEDRAVLRADHHPDDQALRAVRHQRHRAGVGKMAGPSLIPSGDFRTTYAADTTIFPTTTSRNAAIAGIVLICFAPLVLSAYWLSILIQIGIFAIAALGLNILVGFTGQISIGHAAFFLLGAFTSAYISNTLPIPVFFAIPLAGVVTALVGLIFGVPAARLKGLYLVIATLAAQYILLDFFSRADWFSGGSVPASANPFSIFGYTFRGDRQYFYVVLAYLVVSYLLVTNLMRTRDGRALVAIRDHYLSAEIMGINLTKYRTLSFGLAAFFAGIAGALYAHYQLVVSNEGFGIERSIIFLAMVIIGGTGSIMGTLMGTAFVVLLPELMEWISAGLKGSAIDKALSLNNNITFLREIAIGLIIIAFSDVRARRARASLAADQDLLETLPVFALRLERDRLQ